VDYQLDQVYLDKLTQNEENFALEKHFMKMGIPFNQEILQNFKDKLDAESLEESITNKNNSESLFSTLEKAIQAENGGEASENLRQKLKRAATLTFTKEGASEQRIVLSRMIQKNLEDSKKKTFGSDFGKKKKKKTPMSPSSGRSEESGEAIWGNSDSLEQNEGKETPSKENPEDQGEDSSSIKKSDNKKVELFKIVEGEASGSEDEDGHKKTVAKPLGKMKLNLGQLMLKNMRKQKEVSERIESTERGGLETTDRLGEGDTTTEREPLNIFMGSFERDTERRNVEAENEIESPLKIKEDVPIIPSPEKPLRETEEKKESAYKSEGNESQTKKRSSIANFKKALSFLKAKESENKENYDTNNSQASEIDRLSVASKENSQVQEGINKSQSTESINTLGRKHGSKKNLKAALSSIKSKASLASHNSQKYLGEFESIKEAEDGKDNMEKNVEVDLSIKEDSERAVHLEGSSVSPTFNHNIWMSNSNAIDLGISSHFFYFD
jgi:hypothetical protein